MSTTSFAPLDFKPIVDRVIQVFGVFSGATLLFFVKDYLFMKGGRSSTADFFSACCVVAAVIALLLRYILGSAVHLNRTYVPDKATSGKPHNPQPVAWLFFDVLSLVAFGLLAFYLTTPGPHDTGAVMNSVGDFMKRARIFLGAGLAWSAIAYFRANSKQFARPWILIDITQITVTCGLIWWYEAWGDQTLEWLPTWLPSKETVIATLLGSCYLGFLLWDFKVLTRPVPDSKPSGQSDSRSEPRRPLILRWRLWV